jgi:hypothetical protein
MKKDIITALNYITEGRWEEAHEIAQSREGHPDYDRVHALLHRIEGDDFNSRYWYRICKTAFPTISTEEETKLLLDHYTHF